MASRTIPPERTSERSSLYQIGQALQTLADNSKLPGGYVRLEYNTTQLSYDAGTGLSSIALTTTDRNGTTNTFSPTERSPFNTAHSCKRNGVDLHSTGANPTDIEHYHIYCGVLYLFGDWTAFNDRLTVYFFYDS